MVICLPLFSVELIACFHRVGKDWKYNSRYWTYGLRSSETSFKWCSNGGVVASSMWSLGQPDNANDTENCAQMVVYKSNSTVLLEDRECSVVSALACKVLNAFSIQF
jgi:hypothetical protein